MGLWVEVEVGTVLKALMPSIWQVPAFLNPVKDSLLLSLQQTAMATPLEGEVCEGIGNSIH